MSALGLPAALHANSGDTADPMADRGHTDAARCPGLSRWRLPRASELPDHQAQGGSAGRPAKPPATQQGACTVAGAPARAVASCASLYCRGGCMDSISGWNRLNAYTADAMTTHLGNSVAATLEIYAFANLRNMTELREQEASEGLYAPIPG